MENNRVKETEKWLTYNNSTFYTHGSLRYVVILGWTPNVIY